MFLFSDIQSIEYIRKVYDQKCKQLGHQCARDLDAGLIDKTRAVVKDLHSRLGVAIWSVESISKRIEKLRDDELQPQLVELMQGYVDESCSDFVYFRKFMFRRYSQTQI